MSTQTGYSSRARYLRHVPCCAPLRPGCRVPRSEGGCLMGVRIGGRVGPVSASTRVGGKGCGTVLLGAVVLGLLVKFWYIAVAVAVIALSIYLTRKFPALQTQNLFRPRRYRAEKARQAQPPRPVPPPPGPRGQVVGPRPTYVARETFTRPTWTAQPQP